MVRLSDVIAQTVFIEMSVGSSEDGFVVCMGVGIFG